MTDERCKASVHRGHSSPCLRKATKDGYCAQHHPDAAMARREASTQRWKQRLADEAAAREEAAVKLLRRLGYTVTPPVSGGSS
jgi:hypothetical protein